MSTAKTFPSGELNNRELERLAQETTELLKLSVVQALNATVNPDVYKAAPTELSFNTNDSAAVPSVGQIVAERFKQYSPAKQHLIGLDLGRNHVITDQIHRVGIDMESELQVLDQVDLRTRFSFVNGDTFSEEKMQQMVAGLGTPGSPATAEDVEAELQELKERYHGIISAERIEGLISELKSDTVSLDDSVINRILRFRVHEVKCVDETNPEWWGSDEITMGGVAVSETGTATALGEHYVGGGFDDGDRKVFNPPYLMHEFNMSGGTFPKTYAVTVALAERDNGGMSEFIRKLYEAIKGQLTTILASLGAAAGAAIGGAIGGTIGTTIAGPLGTIIGAVAGAIIGLLVGWLVSALKDDIFPPQGSSAFFYAPNGTFPGGALTSPRNSLHFRDHGGHYQITYDWQLIR